MDFSARGGPFRSNRYEGKAPLDDEPFTQFTIVASQVRRPFQLVLPAKMRALLPNASVPVVLNYRNKSWNMVYHGNDRCYTAYIDAGWKHFVLDNKLEVGDCCLFKLKESSTSLVEFEVHLLNGAMEEMQIIRKCKEEEDEESCMETYRETEPLLEDKPLTDLILLKHHVQTPYHVVLPARMRAILPRATVPVVLNYQGKKWMMPYHGDCVSNQRLGSGWNRFVNENKLKVGDGCVFQLTECSPQGIEFSVQILDGEFPLELLERSGGTYPNAPITIE